MANNSLSRGVEVMRSRPKYQVVTLSASTDTTPHADFKGTTIGEIEAVDSVNISTLTDGDRVGNMVAFDLEPGQRFTCNASAIRGTGTVVIYEYSGRY